MALGLGSARPGPQLHDPQRIVDQRRRAVSQVDGGHPARPDTRLGAGSHLGERVAWYRLVVGRLPGQLLVHGATLTRWRRRRDAGPRGKMSECA